MEVLAYVGALVSCLGDPQDTVPVPHRASPAPQAWPSLSAAFSEVSAQRAFFFSFTHQCRHRNAALLFPRSFPAPREPYPGQCVCAGLASRYFFLVHVPHRAPSWQCCSVEPGDCGAPGVSALSVLLRVGSRLNSMGISAAEPLSICPGGSAVLGSAW